MGSIIGFIVARLGVSPAAARAIAYAAGAVLLLLMILAVVKAHDHRIIAAHEAKQDAANARADRKADAAAAEQRRADDARSTDEATQIKEAINEAGNDPAARRAAYYRCVVRQQSARRDGKPSPDC